jgi:hypothetical protein
MSDCDFNKRGVCRVCWLPTAAMPPARRNCTGFRLGDFVAGCLKSLGITPERIEKTTGKPCGCKARQEAMNRWSQGRTR